MPKTVRLAFPPRTEFAYYLVHKPQNHGYRPLLQDGRIIVSWIRSTRGAKVWRVAHESRWHAFLLGGLSSGTGDSPSEPKATAGAVGQLRAGRPADPFGQLLRLPRPRRQKRKAGLRLDTKEGAFAKLKSGGVAIVPGKPDESELIFRIESDDPELQMPPKKSGKQLTRRAGRDASPLGRAGGTWTDALGVRGAAESPRCPPSRTPTWPINEIDRFILARLEAEGLSPAPEAEQDDA